ncbi:MAG: class I SAM-dependent rRNA methyltransferase [Paludibacteraceae bacterium]|jgi:23S rRNA (cytosine1962-C5)-methyltransferase|nr:class I SAM-dependent rRNA methyltransferase [Paludibacteraceae bacterium]
MKKVYLRKGKEDSLLRFHPWVFSGAIAKVDEGIEEGDLVKVISSSGRFVAIGHFQIGSIAVRVLSFEDRDINRLFWEERISAAYEVRKSLHLLREDNNTFRLIHGEGDLLPGLIIDIYGDSAVIQAHSVGMHYVRQTIAEILIETVDGLKNVYYKSETTLPFKAELNDAKENGYLIGSMSDAVGIENGVKFHIDWLRGQKTGFFIDQRENRALLEHYSTGKKVLNMFCYTGGFSCYAMRGGAELVHSVDSSSKAIDLTNKNIELNFQDTSRHQSFAVDAFKFLDEMKTDYDVIVLDPPAFAKHRSALRNALQGYRKLNAKAFEKIKSGGVLFTFSCSQAVNKDQFRLAVFSAAAQSKRKVRILHQLTQPADHPINIYHPEGEYLKGLVLYVE